MIETFEFRILERYASELFADGEGVRLGDRVRKVVLRRDDKRFAEVGRIQAKLGASGESFFFGWEAHMKYLASELTGARLLQLQVRSVFEPAGEECGTVYNEDVACPCCGACGTQVGPLILRRGSPPLARDFCKTIAGEIIVSQKVVDLVERKGISGIQFAPVYFASRRGNQLAKGLHQLTTDHFKAKIMPPTRLGADPFDESSEGKCDCGEVNHVAGLNLLSEVTVKISNIDCADVFESSEFVGVRRGLLRPSRVIFLSQRFWANLIEENCKGFSVEIVHVN
jgi:hypothetical protein